LSGEGGDNIFICLGGVAWHPLGPKNPLKTTDLTDKVATVYASGGKLTL